MSRPIVKDSTDQSVIVRVVDSTDGTPETSVAYNTSGVDLWYRREGGLKVSITEATLAAANTAHADGGFIHIGDGYCRLDLPDAAVATGADAVMVGGTFTGMVVIGAYHPLVSQVTVDASGRVDVSKLAGQTVTAADGVTFPSSIASPTNITAGTITTVSGNVSGNVAGSVGSVTGNVGGNVVGSVASVTAEVSANVTKVNSVAVTGAGTSGDPWGP